jgi:hypothetical protein
MSSYSFPCSLVLIATVSTMAPLGVIAIYFANKGKGPPTDQEGFYTNWDHQYNQNPFGNGVQYGEVELLHHPDS